VAICEKPCMTAAAIAASSAREMVLVISMPFGFTQWETFKLGCYTPDPVSCPTSFFWRLPSVQVQSCQSYTLRVRFGWSCFGVLRRYYNYEVDQC
jgi:hypothetical protein